MSCGASSESSWQAHIQNASFVDLRAAWQDLPVEHQSCIQESLDHLNSFAQEANARGWALLCEGRRVEALAEFSHAIELDPSYAEAFNHRAIAHTLAGQDAAEDVARAEQLTQHDSQRQGRLRQQRKWMCVGFDVRGEPKGAKRAADADFLISFASPDRLENNRILEELKTGVRYNGQIRSVTFCTDKSLGMGLHITEDASTRWNPLFSDLEQPRQPGEYPAWFKHYKTAVEETKHGLLILQLTDAYLKSKACRWEFGYIRRPELVHVFIPGADSTPGCIVRWQELMGDAQLCRRCFGKALEEILDTDEAKDGDTDDAHAFNQIKKLADTAEEQEYQAWCRFPLQQLACTFAKNQFGEESLEWMDSAASLLVVYLKIGFVEEAKELGQVLLANNEARYGEDHPEVARILTDLGSAHGRLGDYATQKKLLERALKIEESHFGEDHPEVAATLTNLGNAHGRLGNYAKQKELLERALKIEESHFGEDHPEVANTLMNLGISHGQLGNYAKQKELLERALKIKEEHFGEDHPEVANTLMNLGNAHGRLGDYATEKKLLERALKIKEQHFGEDHPEVAAPLGNLGNAHGNLGNYATQKELLERALKIDEEHFGEDHPEVAMTLTNLGNAHGRLGDYATQKTLLERALKIKEEHFGEDHPEVANTLTNLGNAHGDLGNYATQKKLLERALKIEESHFGEDHPEVAATLTNLGTAHGDLGDHAKKKDLLERALKIEEEYFGKEHPQVAITLFNLGVACANLGNLGHAEEVAVRALNIFERHDHPHAETVRRFRAKLEKEGNSCCSCWSSGCRFQGMKA